MDVVMVYVLCLVSMMGIICCMSMSMYPICALVHQFAKFSVTFSISQFSQDVPRSIVSWFCSWTGPEVVEPRDGKP